MMVGNYNFRVALFFSYLFFFSFCYENEINVTTLRQPSLVNTTLISNSISVMRKRGWWSQQKSIVVYIVLHTYEMTIDDNCKLVCDVSLALEIFI